MSDSTRQSGESANQRTVFDPQNQAVQGQNRDTERHGSLEPDDSRNVTGAAGQGVGAPGGSDQQQGGERWGGGQVGEAQTPNAAGYVDQQTATEDEIEFDADPQIEGQGEVAFEPSGDLGGGQMGQSQSGGGMGQQQQFSDRSGGQMGGGEAFSQIREHMEVIGADGVHLGTVDKVEGDRIKLTKADSGMGSHEGHHHYIARGLVAEVEGDRVRLSANADVAYGMQEEE